MGIATIVGYVENASPGGHPNHTKRLMEGGPKDSQSNACPDELRGYDGTKYLIYLSYDHYGHGGIEKIEGTQKYATYHIQNMSDKYWDFVYPIVT